MKDIFLDSCLANNLINPVDSEYKHFLNWINKDGALVITNKLIKEYGQGNQNLVATIDKLTKNGRINKITNTQLKDFKFKKSIENSFTSNYKDLVHIKSIVLSDRKMGIIGDNNLLKDVNNLPNFNKIKPQAACSPSNLNYK